MGRAKKYVVKTQTTRKTAYREGDSWRWWYLWAALVGFVAVLVMLIFSITVFSRNSPAESKNPTSPPRPT